MESLSENRLPPDRRPSGKISAMSANIDKTPVLGYRAAPKETPTKVFLKGVGLASCIGLFGCGLVAIFYGADGVRYALLKAPMVDRSEDLFGALLLGSIGILAAIFAARWGYLLIKALRTRVRDGSNI